MEYLNLFERTNKTSMPPWGQGVVPNFSKKCGSSNAQMISILIWSSLALLSENNV